MEGLDLFAFATLLNELDFKEVIRLRELNRFWKKRVEQVFNTQGSPLNQLAFKLTMIYGFSSPSIPGHICFLDVELNNVWPYYVFSQAHRYFRAVAAEYHDTCRNIKDRRRKRGEGREIHYQIKRLEGIRTLRCDRMLRMRAQLRKLGTELQQRIMDKGDSPRTIRKKTKRRLDELRAATRSKRSKIETTNDLL